MLCDFCHQKESAFFIEQTANGINRKINLCMDCAIAKGVTPDPRFLERSVGGLFAELARVSGELKKESGPRCPVCGTSLLSIKKTRSVGCPECYSIFKDEIFALLKEGGVSGAYSGSMPRRLRAFRSVLTDRIDLQAKLEASLKNEDYEKAAIYRDYLKALEKSPVSGGDDE